MVISTGQQKEDVDYDSIAIASHPAAGSPTQTTTTSGTAPAPATTTASSSTSSTPPAAPVAHVSGLGPGTKSNTPPSNTIHSISTDIAGDLSTINSGSNSPPLPSSVFAHQFSHQPLTTPRPSTDFLRHRSLPSLPRPRTNTVAAYEDQYSDDETYELRDHDPLVSQPIPNAQVDRGTISKEAVTIPSPGFQHLRVTRFERGVARIMTPGSDPTHGLVGRPLMCVVPFRRIYTAFALFLCDAETPHTHTHILTTVGNQLLYEHVRIIGCFPFWLRSRRHVWNHHVSSSPLHLSFHLVVGV